jgi:hypothetical protein
MKKLFGVLALFAVSGLSHAQTTPQLRAALTGFTLGPGGTFVRTDAILSAGAPGSRIIGLSAGVLTVTDATVLAGPAGNLAVSSAARVTLAEAGAAIGRCLIGVNVPCAAVALAVPVALATYRYYHPSNVPGSVVPPGSLDYDPGMAPNVTGQQLQWRLAADQAWAPYTSDGEILGASAARRNAAATGGATNWQAAVSSGTSHVVNGVTVNHVGDVFCSSSTAPAFNGQCGPAYQVVTVSNGLCGASVDAGNPAYNVPAGGAVGPDGKCPTARYNHVPKSPTDVGVSFTAYPPTAGTYDVGTGAITGGSVPKALGDAIKLGGESVPYSLPTNITGPGSQVGTPTTTTTSTGSPPVTTTKTDTPTYNYTYTPTTINYSTTTTTVNGNTTTTIVAPPQDIKTCGYPGGPPCKIDETGTAPFTAPTTAPELPILQPMKDAEKSKRDEVQNSTPGPTFGFIGAPSIAACTPFVMPTQRVGFGASATDVQIPPLDPCSAVNTLRDVMGYVWAIAAAWLSLGMIRKTTFA